MHILTYIHGHIFQEILDNLPTLIKVELWGNFGTFSSPVFLTKLVTSLHKKLQLFITQVVDHIIACKDIFKVCQISYPVC